MPIPRIKTEDIPHGARIMGLAPVGVRAFAAWNKPRGMWTPENSSLPASEFAALEVVSPRAIIDIPPNDNYVPAE